MKMDDHEVNVCGSKEKYSDSGYCLKVEPTIFVN